MKDAKHGGNTALNATAATSLRLRWLLAQVAGCTVFLAACGGGNNQSVTAADGSAGAPTPAPAAGSGSATLSWQAPQTKADGSALTDLAGYRIYYGTASGNYSRTVTISDPATTTYTIQNLPASTYFFVLRSYDKSGLESSPTPEASKTIS